MSLSHAAPRLTDQRRRAAPRAGDLEQDMLFTGTDFVTEAPHSSRIGTDEDIDLRQLRHHTKNALQRIIGLVAQAPGLADTPEGAQIARQLERRIQLSAAISDALFGLTRAPEAMTDRLRSLCGYLVELLSDPAQIVQVGVSIRGECPVHLRETVLRVAHELVGNAVKHGMRRQRRGRIAVRLHTEPGVYTRLTVIDDGHGFHGRPKEGEGLTLARLLAEENGGSVSLESDGRTIAALYLPHAHPRKETRGERKRD
ncbi:MAG: ATP-binding protein [Acetobacteraceae bacterium]